MQSHGDPVPAHGSDFVSGGYELFLPPTPLNNPDVPLSERRAHFVMLDDLRNIFFDVDFEDPELKNDISQIQSMLHTIEDPAIVFPPQEWQKLQDDESKIIRITGFLVAIVSRTPVLHVAKRLGKVHIHQLRRDFMNWSALVSRKGPELPAELRNGFLRFSYNRREDVDEEAYAFQTPRVILERMSRPWHEDPASLNYELNHLFAGGKAFEDGIGWKILGAINADTS